MLLSLATLLLQVSWIDYDGELVPRRSLAPGAWYFERSFATHPWVIQYDNSDAGVNTESLHRGRLLGEGDPEGRRRQHQNCALQEGAGSEYDGDCCVVRLGDAMSHGRLTGSLIWNPAGRTLSITKQAKVGVPGMSAASNAAVGSYATDGAGLDPGRKRLCMVGPLREAEEARARAVRSSVRGEKIRILREMKTWRTHPPGVSAPEPGGGGGQRGDGGWGVAESVAGRLGQGEPHLRVVMVGSSSLGDSE